MLKIAWSKIYAHPLPENHRFPMEKYDLLPQQLLYEGTIEVDNLFEPKPLAEQYILDTHDLVYWQKLKHLQLTRKEERRTGFPLSATLIEREITIMQGTLQAALYALEYGIGMNIAGGTHHAFTDRGEGFCLLNDIAIAANYLINKNLADKILVVDLDVHQGNGTAQIFRKQPKVFTFSMHGKNNYPLNKEQSDLDIPLLDGTDDATYIDLLQQKLPQLIDQLEPDLIFYQSGVDVLAEDKLGRLGLTLDGCKRRDQLVLELAFRHQIPLVACMGGGYAPQIARIIEAHSNLYRLAQYIYF